MPVTCDPTSLAQDSTCMECIPSGARNAVRTYLLCQWVSKTATTCDVVITGAGDPDANQTYSKVSDSEYDAPNGYSIRVVSDMWVIISDMGDQIYQSSGDQTGPWSVIGVGIAPAPTGAFSPDGCVTF